MSEQKISFTDEELEKLGKLTMMRLVHDFGNNLINKGKLNDDVSVAEYLNDYFIAEQKVSNKVVPIAGALKRFGVDQYYDKEMKQYAVTDIIEADCKENIELQR